MKAFKRVLYIFVFVFLIMAVLQFPDYAYSSNLTTKMKIEAPTNKASVKETITVKGWALSGSEINKVEVFIGNKLVGTAEYGLTRRDVSRAYPSYPKSDRSGYAYELNTTKLKPGSHTLKVKVTDKNGKITMQTRQIKVTNPVQKAKVEKPTNGTVKGTIDVKGWALNSGGIAKVEVFVGKKLMGKAQYGLKRADVGRAYPKYAEASSGGYLFKLDTTKVSQGSQVIKVKVTGKNGEVTTLSKTVKVVYPEPKTKIEAPLHLSETTGEILIKGWALNGFGVKKVEVYIDDKLKGQAQYGLVRGDVAKAYPYYTNVDKSGYQFTFDTDQIKNGTHTLKIKVTGKNGKVHTVKRTFKSMNPREYYKQYDETLDEIVNLQYNLKPVTDENSSEWIRATKAQVKKYVDPKNFIDHDQYKFMFLRLNFTYGITAEDLNEMLNKKGILHNKGEVFLKAAREYDINPAYLVSHALLETGNGSSALAKGYSLTTYKGEKLSEPVIVYNMFGIGAYDRDPEQLGAEYAYSEKWFTVDASILGGAKFISEKYVNNPEYKQNTLYKMRWNPDCPGTHQYATDIGWARKQTKNIKNLMDQFPDAILIYEIPVYK